MKICRMIKSELDVYAEKCNFTEEELKIFWKLSKGKTIPEIAISLSVSESIVSRRIKDIENKMKGVSLMNSERSVPIWEKLTLTIEEASEYSGIGINKLYKMLAQPSSEKFVLRNGKRKLIKRKAFETYIADSEEV